MINNIDYPQFSIVLPLYNKGDHILRALSSILNQTINDYEIIVVDNNSQDSTIEIAQSFPVKPITCKKPGAAAAMNKGIAEAKGDIICITESDCIIPSSWLRNLTNCLNRNPEFSGVGGPILPYKTLQKVERLNSEIYLEDQTFPKKLEETKYLKRRNH